MDHETRQNAMSKEKQAGPRPEQKNGRTPQPAVQNQPAAESIGLAELALALSGLSAAAGDPGTQVSRLADRRLGTAQRQGLARQISKQRNDHLQHLIANVQRDGGSGSNGILSNGNGHLSGNWAAAHTGASPKPTRGRTSAGGRTSARGRISARGGTSAAAFGEVLPNGLGGLGRLGFAATGSPGQNGKYGKHGKHGRLKGDHLKGVHLKGDHLPVQREEEDGTPTEEVKAAALADAQRAEGQAGQSADHASAETAKSRSQQANEIQNAQNARQKTESVQSESSALSKKAAPSAPSVAEEEPSAPGQAGGQPVSPGTLVSEPAPVQQVGEQAPSSAQAVKVGEEQYEIGGLHISGDEIQKMIRRIAIRIYDEQAVKSGAEEIAGSKRYTQVLRPRSPNGKAQDISTTRIPSGKIDYGTGRLAQIRYLRERVKPAFREREEVTTQYGPYSSIVESEQRGGTAPYVKGPGKYIDLAEKLRATGKSPAIIARGIKTYIRYGTVPLSLEGHSGLISQTAELMVGVEGMRNPASIVTTPMLFDLMTTRLDPARERAGREPTFKEQLERHPMSMGKAESVSDRVNKELGFEELQVMPGRKRSASGPKAEIFKKKEIQLVMDWVKMKVDSSGIESFESKEKLEEFIETQIRAFYNLRDQTPETA
jgi:hypothetical protein